LRNDPELLRNLRFSAASQIWLETRKPYLKVRPFYLAGQHVKHLSVFFGEMQVRKIHIGHIREYQKARTHNPSGLWKHRAGPSLINHETSALQSVLKRAGEWDKIKPHFEALPMPRWKPPKVLSDEQEMLVFSIASSNPKWELAAWAASLTVNTSVAGVELRSIQLQHVNMDSRIPTLLVDAETAKEEIRGRIVVLNSTAQVMMTNCLKRAAKLGSYEPNHYLFPFRKGPGNWEPTKPTTASWLRRPFEELRAATGIPWLTPHCFRHQHATLSYEAGEPEQTIRLRMGHVSERMTRYYSNLRRESQKTAVDAIDQMARFRARA
jgi:integrase